MSENLENGIFLIRNVGSGKYLNIWGTDQVSNSRNVCQYDLLAELNQLFWVQRTNSGVLKLSSIMQDSAQNFYSLNINGSTGNANLYREEASNDVDSAVVFENVEGSHYRIRLEHARSNGSYVYLTAIGSGNGSSVTTNSNGNVMWLALSGDSNQQVWDMEFMVQYPDYTFDIRKLDAQIFLHKFYNSTITIDAQAGTVLCRELVKALQQILLGLHEGSEGYGNFGPATLAACPDLFVGMTPSGSLTEDKLKRLITLFCHAMFCKGYSTVGIYDTYNANVASGVKSLQASAGLEQDGIVTPQLMKAVFNTDSYVLSLVGDSRIREIQMAMNGGYNDYTGINPCDGVYGRATNNALICAVLKEEGISVEESAASFGNRTFSLFPTLPFTGDSKEDGINETNLIKILQYALYANGMYTGLFDGVYSSTVEESVLNFQEFMAYPTPWSTSATARVMKGLLASCGDTSRTCIAVDTSQVLTNQDAYDFFASGVRYVGRYLTGTVRGADGIRRNKAITPSEAQIIVQVGLHIVPIYQDGGTYVSYFNANRGEADALAAIAAADALKFPNETTIYFAVDCDPLESQITTAILPYFRKIKTVIDEAGRYNVGAYGTRNVCNRLYEDNLTVYSYVSDMSTGYSGNLGFRMPVNWAFDQFAEISDGLEHTIDFDKVGYSGRDEGVSYLLSTPSEDATPEQIQAAYQKRFSTFQEDLPLLNAITPSSIVLEEEITIVQSANYRVSVVVSSEVVDEPSNGYASIILNVTDGALSPSAETSITNYLNAIKANPDYAELWDAYEGDNQDGVEATIDLLGSMALSVRTGKIYFSVVPDILNKTITYVLAATTDDFQVAANVSATFSMEIRIETRLDDDSNAGGIIDSFTTVNATDVVFGLLVAGALIGLFVAPQVELPAILSSLITLITSSLPALVAA